MRRLDARRVHSIRYSPDEIGSDKTPAMRAFFWRISKNVRTDDPPEAKLMCGKCERDNRRPGVDLIRRGATLYALCRSTKCDAIEAV